MAGNLEENQQHGWLTDLDENKKRWVVTGIVLHSVLTPTLREYVTDSLEQIYQTLKQNNSIDTQTHPNQLKSYLNTFLNYETINGNKSLGLRQQSRFNYEVKDAVNFSKLFLQTNMAHYTAFDDSCDSSALLAIIIGSCPGASQASAKKVKDEVRNPWAHCDFTVWDDNKYKICMKLIKELIESMGLQNQEEIISLLQKWNRNGDKYIDGTSPEFVVLGEVQTQVHTLLSCIEKIASDTPDRISKLKEELNITVSDLMKRVQDLEKAHQETTLSVERLKEIIDEKEDTIPKHMKEKYQIHIDEWKKDEETFSVTRATEHVTGLLEENDVVVVTGSSGSGKSSLIHHVALILETQGYTIIPFVSGPDDIIRYRDMKKNQVFIIDDLCGKNYIDYTDLQIWKKHTDKIEKLFPSNLCNEQGRLKILVSCRLQIYQDKRFKSLTIFTNSVVDLQSNDHCYLEEEKRRMIGKYIKNSISDYCWQEIIEKLEDCHFFPLLCKMSQHKAVEQLTDLFSAPIECIRKDIKDMIQANAMENCALVLCVLFPDGFDELLLKPKSRQKQFKAKLIKVLTGLDITMREERQIEKLEKEVQKKITKIVTNFKINLDIEKDRRELINTLERLDGTYVKKTGSLYFISHDKLYDMVAVEGCYQITDLYLEYAPSTLIAEQFRFESVFPKEDNQFLIYINDNDENLYLKRCFEDLNRRVYKPFFKNEQLKDEQYKNKVMEYIYQNKKSCDKLFRRLDKKGMTFEKHNDYYNYEIYTTTPVIEATKTKFYQLIKYLIDIKCDLNKQDSDGNSPLWYSCHGGFINIISLFLNHNVKYVDVLVAAVWSGKTDAVRSIVESGMVDLTQCDSKGNTPLNAACNAGLSEIVKLLLNHNVKYNADDFFMACRHGMTDAVRVMVERGLVDLTQCHNKTEQSPLNAACKGGHGEIVNLLLNHDIKYNVDDLVEACRHGMTDAVRVMVERGLVDPTQCHRLVQTPLNAACEGGHNDTIDILLNHNFTYDIDDLVRACYRGKTDVVRLMVEKGQVDVTQRSSRSGRTPLTTACVKGHSDIVNLLLNHNVKYNVDDLVEACRHGMTDVVRSIVESGMVDLTQCSSRTGQTPINAACERGHIEIINLLLNHNVKYNVDDLFEACKRGVTDAVRLLVERGLVDLTQCHNKTEQSPLNAACKEGHGEIVNLLLNHDIKYNVDDLVEACRHDMTGVVRSIIESGMVDLTQCDSKGNTPLNAACNAGLSEIVKLLLNHNVKYNADDFFMAC